MRKTLIYIMIIMMIISLTGCGKKPVQDNGLVDKDSSNEVTGEQTVQNDDKQEGTVNTEDTSDQTVTNNDTNDQQGTTGNESNGNGGSATVTEDGSDLKIEIGEDQEIGGL